MGLPHAVSAPLTGLPGKGRCLVMGILNVTPDSFSDGGEHGDVEKAVHYGLELVAAGADIVDVGGESTRPGADPVPLEEELARVLPVVRGLAAAGVLVSVDTMHAVVALAALDAGAGIVNDVSGGLADPAMAKVIAEFGVPYVAMHWRAPSREMARYAHYDDVVNQVARELLSRVDVLVEAGVDPRQLVLDPGLGFAKRPEHDRELVARLDELTTLGFPLLVGASRKSFLGATLGDGDPTRVPPSRREAATVAITALAVARGAACVRVHDVASNLDAVRIAHACSQPE